MSATFRTRPWRPLSLRVSPLAGSTSRTTQGVVRSALIPSSSRYASSGMRSQKRIQDARLQKSRASYESPSNLAQAAQLDVTRPGSKRSHTLLDFLVPRTFVPLPLSKRPRGIANFFEYYWARLRYRAFDMFTLFALRMGSKPGYLKKARLALNRSSIVPTAKGLHRTMSEALARGDKDTLQNICTTQLYLDLCQAIDRRPRGKRFGWEVVQYTKPLRFPRVVDHKLAIFGDAASGAPGIRQAVVGISSRQRRVEYDDSPRGGGAVVPGSEKEMDVVEYLVINRTVDMRTYEQGEWRVWGTINPTSLAQLRDDIALMDRAQEEEKEKLRQKRKQRLETIRRTGV